MQVHLGQNEACGLELVQRDQSQRRGLFHNPIFREPTHRLQRQLHKFVTVCDTKVMARIRQGCMSVEKRGMHAPGRRVEVVESLEFEQCYQQPQSRPLHSRIHTKEDKIKT